MLFLNIPFSGHDSFFTLPTPLSRDSCLTSLFKLPTQSWQLYRLGHQPLSQVLIHQHTQVFCFSTPLAPQTQQTLWNHSMLWKLTETYLLYQEYFSTLMYWTITNSVSGTAFPRTASQSLMGSCLLGIIQTLLRCMGLRTFPPKEYFTSPGF